MGIQPDPAAGAFRYKVVWLGDSSSGGVAYVPRERRAEGLMLGMQYCTLRTPPRARFCIYQGMLGVMFTMPGRAAKA